MNALQCRNFSPPTTRSEFVQLVEFLEKVKESPAANEVNRQVSHMLLCILEFGCCYTMTIPEHNK